jgi:hypothetical protein
MTLKENVQPVELPFSLVEAVAGTYISIEIELPTNIQQGWVFDLDLIEWNMSPLFDPVAAGNTLFAWQFTFNDQAALLGWDNNQILAAGVVKSHASAALVLEGLLKNLLHHDTRGRANLVAKPEIFLGIDSTNTTAVTTFEGRLIGSITKLDQKQLTQLVLSQIRA